MRSSIVYGSRENFRIVSVGPRRASGGMIAFTRLPSGRRASTIGEDSSTRLPICETILSMIRSRWASSTNDASVASILPVRSTKIFVRAVDHDLRHGVVTEERLQRPVAEDVVGDVGDDLAALLAGERRAVESELLHDRPHDPFFEVVGRLGREELGAQPRDARVVDAGLQLGVRIGLLRVLVPACTSRAASDVPSAPFSWAETTTGPLMRSWRPTTSSASGRAGSSCRPSSPSSCSCRPSGPWRARRWPSRSPRRDR